MNETPLAESDQQLANMLEALADRVGSHVDGYELGRLNIAKGRRPIDRSLIKTWVLPRGWIADVVDRMTREKRPTDGDAAEISQLRAGVEELLAPDSPYPSVWPAAGNKRPVPIRNSDLEMFLRGEGRREASPTFVDYFLTNWRPVLAGHRRWCGFNWPSMVLLWIWFLYRRMYLAALVVQLATEAFFAAIVFISAAAHLPFLGNPLGLLLGGLPFRILIGSVANRLYLARAVAQVYKARSRDHDEAPAAIRKAGGVSPVIMMAGLAVTLFSNLYWFGHR